MMIVSSLFGCSVNKYGVLGEINTEINKIPYKSDILNTGKIDTWLTPDEFYKKNAGDCEDFAIAKYFELRKNGYIINEMLITYAMIDINNEALAHMVVIVKGLVLDNVTNDIVPLKDRKDLTLSYQFNEDDLIIEGRRFPSTNILKWRNLIERVRKERRSQRQIE